MDASTGDAMATDAQVKAAKITAIAAVAVALLGLLGQTIGVLPSFRSSNGSSADAVAASPIPTAQSPSPSPSSPTQTTASSSAADLPPSDPALQYLSDMEAVQGDSNIHVSKLNDGRETREYNSSIMAGINNFNPKYTYVYAIDNGWKFFRATIGIDPDILITNPDLINAVAPQKARDIRAGNPDQVDPPPAPSGV